MALEKHRHSRDVGKNQEVVECRTRWSIIPFGSVAIVYIGGQAMDPDI